MDHHWLCLVVMEHSVCSMMSSYLTWMLNFQHGVKYQDLHLPCPGHGIVLALLTIQNWWFQEGVRVLVCFSVTLTFWMSQWKNLYGEIPASWTMPSRLGHPLSVYNGRKILMFGGLAKSGPLRLGSNDVFTMDLSEEPCWRCITGSGMPDAGNPAGIGPPPHLDHVAGSLPGGRILIFGGSVAGLHSASQLYLLDQLKRHQHGGVLNVPGSPQFAWES